MEETSLPSYSGRRNSMFFLKSGK